jgi:hypothetical protein
VSAKNPIATLDETETASPAQRSLMTLQIPADLPPSNEELEVAVQSSGLFNSAMKYMRPLDQPIQLRNKTKQKLWERATAEAKELHEKNLFDGIPDDDEFMWPEEPTYERTTSYQDFTAQLGDNDRVRVLIEVARNRAKRDRK